MNPNKKVSQSKYHVSKKHLFEESMKVRIENQVLKRLLLGVNNLISSYISGEALSLPEDSELARNLKQIENELAKNKQVLITKRGDKIIIDTVEKPNLVKKNKTKSELAEESEKENATVQENANWVRDNFDKIKEENEKIRNIKPGVVNWTIEGKRINYGLTKCNDCSEILVNAPVKEDLAYDSLTGEYKKFKGITDFLKPELKIVCQSCYDKAVVKKEQNKEGIK